MLGCFLWFVSNGSGSSAEDINLVKIYLSEDGPKTAVRCHDKSTSKTVKPYQSIILEGFDLKVYKMRPDGPRASLAGPENGPEEPLPIKLQGPIIKGFGRGSKELGIPTANLPPEGLSAYPDLPSGIYYGFVGLSSESNPNSQHTTTFPAVLSIGFNPFYKNTVRSVEIHILHEFEHDFYGAYLNLLILGFIRPEYDYVSKESLIDDINTDCQVAQNSLARPAYADQQETPWLKNFDWSKDIDTEKLQDVVLGKA